MTEPSTEVIDMDAPNTEPVNNSGALVNELAATSLAILDAEEERRSVVKTINEKIKKLKGRQRDLATTIKAGGIQLAMNFATFPTDTAVSVEGPKKRGRKPATDEPTH
jgi:hypothetical protein